MPLRGRKDDRVFTVLVVDDQEEVRHVLRHVFERDGRYAIADAGSASEAMDALEAEAPDAVILDISMPETTGLIVLRAIREASPRTKILVLSSHFDMGEEVVAMGADAFLPKTSPPKTLLKTVADLLAL